MDKESYFNCLLEIQAGIAQIEQINLQHPKAS